MDPADALARIAYLLDRSLAGERKTGAFLKAEEIVRAEGSVAIAERVANNTLEDLPGIGASTGAVIRQAVNGQVPDRLAELEATTVIPLGEGTDLHALMKGDCHAHSTWSDGGASVEQMAHAAMDLGHEYLVMTDHSPRLTVAHGLSADRLRAQLDEIRELNERLAPFRILTGIEVDILVDGALDQNEELLAELDIVVASVHSKLSMDRPSMTARMVYAVCSPHVDILGHCTGRKVKPTHVPNDITPAAIIRDQSLFDAEIVFLACAQNDVAVEINCRPERQDPPDDLLDLALSMGCKISIDTDAHAPGHLEFQRFGCDKAARHEIDPDIIINTWPADRLLEWAEAHGGS